VSGNSLDIGSHRIGPWILAPMAGVSELPYRLLALEMGASAAPTELISARGLGSGHARSIRYLAHDPRERPLWVQLHGGDAEWMARGAELAVEHGAAIIDINMGCPVRKITRNGAGSALLCDPPRAAAIVEAVARRAEVPVTVKMRSGWDARSADPGPIARALAAAGASAIAIHARTRAQGYGGTADWGLIRRLVEVSPIPVIGNGDAFTAADARRMLAETGCAAVMIGRGALGNPWIFRQLRGGSGAPEPSERWSVVARHFAAHIEHVGDERRAIHRFRSHLEWYAQGLVGASAFRDRAVRIDDRAELLELCEAYFTEAQPSDGRDARLFGLARALG
jgi:nifR3 family TIM-barrel protein